MPSKSKVETPELSIIITAHAEGIIAHKTMRCVFENQKLLDENHISSEIIIHIDAGTKETKDYFKRYQNTPNLKIFENSFRDLGESRNFANKMAKGNYVAFIDADDLVSPNWLLSAYRTIKHHESTVLVHPEAVLDFGINVTHPRLWLQKDSKTSKIENAKDLIVTNRWVSTIAGPKQIFLNFPYPPTEHGFGNEDYEFNLATISAGILHLVAPETILFYRQKLSGSLLSQSATEKYVQRFSPLFDIDFYRKKYKPPFEPPEPPMKEKTAKEKAVERYVSLRNHHPVINKMITPAATLAKKITGKTVVSSTSALSPEEEKKKQIPKFVLKEWKEINQIDANIYPNDALLRNLWFYRPEENNAYAKAYYELTKNIQELPEHIFIVPDNRHIKNIQSKTKAAIITTDADNSETEQLPSNAALIEFGRATNGMEEFGKDYLLSQLLVQLSCKKIHIIDSDFGYRWVASHRTLVKDNFELDVSVLANNVNPCLAEIYPLVHRIFVDDSKTASYLSESNGFELKKIVY